MLHGGDALVNENSLSPSLARELRAHLHSVEPCPSHASSITRSSYLHMRGYSSPLETNVTTSNQNYKYAS
jgi:hypothetical protein